MQLKASVKLLLPPVKLRCHRRAYTVLQHRPLRYRSLQQLWLMLLCRLRALLRRQALAQTAKSCLSSSRVLSSLHS